METEWEKFKDQLEACNKAANDGIQMNIEAMHKVDKGFMEAMRAWQVDLKDKEAVTARSATHLTEIEMSLNLALRQGASKLQASTFMQWK